MRFKIDENLPIEVVALLQEAGHDALHVLDQGLGGKDDAQIANICRKERRAIISVDIGFADIRTYPPKEFDGIVVVRIKRQDKGSVLAVFTRLVKALQDGPIEGNLWIVDERRIRIRT